MKMTVYLVVVFIVKGVSQTKHCKMETWEKGLVNSKISHSIFQPLVKPATAFWWSTISVRGKQEDAYCRSASLTREDVEDGNEWKEKRRRRRRRRKRTFRAPLVWVCLQGHIPTSYWQYKPHPATLALWLVLPQTPVHTQYNQHHNSVMITSCKVANNTVELTLAVPVCVA